MTEDPIYVDIGYTGTTRERPGLRAAPRCVAVRHTLVVTNLDRLARSITDARSIADELTTKKVALSPGGSACDPADPVGKALLSVLSVVSEFEADLIRMRTREDAGRTG